MKADVTIVTESWLHADISNDLLYLKKCDIFRCDRKLRKGGGVCIWVNHNFTPRLLQSPFTLPPFIEFIAIRLHCISFSLLCCGLYVPPGLTKFEHETIAVFLTNEFDQLLSMYSSDKLLLAGDFNDFSTLFLCENFNLVNRVMDATRLNAILDHIWIDESLCHSYPTCAEVGPPLQKSDHNTVLLRSTRQVASTENHQSTLLWDFRESNICEFLKRLESTEFELLERVTSVDTHKIL